jgi:hypothetical protein
LPIPAAPAFSNLQNQISGPSVVKHKMQQFIFKGLTLSAHENLQYPTGFFIFYISRSSFLTLDVILILLGNKSLLNTEVITYQNITASLQINLDHV